MIFQKSLMANSLRSSGNIMQLQFNEVKEQRRKTEAIERHYASLGLVAVNEGIIPEDVYQDFDNVSVTEFRSDEGDAFLNDLLGLSRSVNIGKTVSKFRRASGAGNSQASLRGQSGVVMDQVDFNYDGTVIPIHDNGFSRTFREFEAMRSEGFDALIDDQRETVRSLRKHVVSQFLNGHKDNKGNLITVDGIQWGGMRNDSRVAQVDLGAGGVNFDFTDPNKTYAEIEAAFKQVINVLWISNNAENEATVYISREIATNFDRNSSEYASSDNKILQRLAGLQGVREIKVSSALSGNEFMAYPLNGLVRPVVGMGLNTVAVPRTMYNDDHKFVNWMAAGFEVRTDFSGQTPALFAQG